MIIKTTFLATFETPLQAADYKGKTFSATLSQINYTHSKVVYLCVADFTDVVDFAECHGLQHSNKLPLSKVHQNCVNPVQ